MTELALFLATVALTGVLLRPLLRKAPLPEWLARARARGRPGVPVTAWLGAAGAMGLAWLIGEQRGLIALVLLLVWLVAPVLAAWISLLWLRRRDAA